MPKDHRTRVHGAQEPAAAPAASAGMSSRLRPWIVGGLLVVICGIAGYSIGALTDRGSAAAPGAAAQASVPQVVAGDGLSGPSDMVWIPGGEFLMGSDHQRARDAATIRTTRCRTSASASS